MFVVLRRGLKEAGEASSRERSGGLSSGQKIGSREARVPEKMMWSFMGQDEWAGHSA